MKLQHHINQALHANGVMHRDQQYVVKDGQVLIVDEFTGRIMPGRRYSDGLHQAIEGKKKALRLKTNPKRLLQSRSRISSVCMEAFRYDRYGSYGGGGISAYIQA